MSPRPKSKKKNKKSKKTIVRTNKCVNPLKTTGHTKRDLRKIPQNILKFYPDLPKNSRICAKCRKAVHKLFSSSSSDNPDMLNPSHDDQDDDEEMENGTVNNDDSRSEQVNIEKSEREKDFEEMLEGLKDLYKSLPTTDPLRIRILAVAPQSWSVKKISREFEASERQSKNAKKLRNQAGILEETKRKGTTTLSHSTIQSVIEFYTNDDNSKMMAGRKDFKTIIVGKERKSVQKRLLLLDVRELYSSYKEAYPKNKVGFSTFCKLRPKNVILPGKSGTHAVCVCTKHENIKMMLEAINIKNLSKNWENPIKDYRDCLKVITCENSTEQCHFNECDKCPEVQSLQDKILRELEEENISEVEYGYWTSTDRATLLNIVDTSEDFVEKLSENLKDLKTHSFIAKSQSAFINQRKASLRNHEMIVMFDFSENYKYVAQNASQAFHFNNNQCTVFPVAYYYKEKGELKQQSCVFLSDSLKHDTAAVYAAQSILLKDIKRKFKFIKHIIYMTDGAKQHFKNRYQISNLRQHQADFALSAEWHFSASAHGKSAYDGIGAAFKREAYRASLLAKPTEAILTFQKLKSWAKNHFKSIVIYDFDQTFHANMQRRLNKRFSEAKAITGIQIKHSFIFIGENLIINRVSAN